MGMLSEDGIDRFTYHDYVDKGRAVLGDGTLKYDAEGWPTAATDAAAGK